MDLRQKWVDGLEAVKVSSNISLVGLVTKIKFIKTEVNANIHCICGFVFKLIDFRPLEPH